MDEEQMNAELDKIVIDTDVGIDDALSILLLLAAEAKHPKKFQVVALTCTYGNAQVDHVVRNVLRVLTVARRTDIPVYKGAHKPLLYDIKLDNFHGADGFGEAKFDQDVTRQHDCSKHASNALIDIAQRHRGNVSILALGPLTNIALAIKLDPSFVKNVKQFHIMGGSVWGRGNIAPNAEFNFYQDPESNFVLFDSITDGKPVVLVPWETVVNGTTQDWRKKMLKGSDSVVIKFLDKVYEWFDLKPEDRWGGTADAICASVTLWPGLVGHRQRISYR